MEKKHSFLLIQTMLFFAIFGLMILFAVGCEKNTVSTDGDQNQTEAISETITDAIVPDTANTTEPTSEPKDTVSGNGWKNAPADQLYYPNSSVTTNDVFAYVFCTDTDEQDYVKMRMGPSKDHFDVSNEHISNYRPVIVKSVSVNGWTFCKYNETEGWIRSDFVFEDMNDIIALLKDGDRMPEGFYRVTIDDEYAGEPLNMREEPTKDSALIKELPNGTELEVSCDAVIQNGWVYAKHYKTINDNEDYSGYVLVKYLSFLTIAMGDKPILYLYPEKETAVDVYVNLAENVFFTCTYPTYQNGWHVTAQPDGTLTDRVTGKDYAYLYWELGGSAAYDFSSGFVVKGCDTSAFLEEKLTEIGLSARERNEFIVYWLPRMQRNPYNLISFQQEAYTSLVDLQISPSPDSLLRVFMAYRPLTAPVEITPQQFTPFERNGFTAVEWGGVEYPFP